LVPSRKWLPWLACAAIAVAGFPGLAQGEAESSDPPATGAIVAEDNFFHEVGSAASDSTVEIAAGGKVTFGYPSGNSVHNVVFDGALSPASCTQTSGTVFPGTVPPLPTFPGSPGWAGECTFSTPGTYTFVCNAHKPSMAGTVIVDAVGTPTPTPTGTPTPTPTPTPTATPTPTPTPSNAAADIEAHDNFFSNKDVTIKPGESVHFGYPSGGTVHNVKFDNAQPVCTQTAGVVFPGAIPPLPANAAPAGWEGECKFDSPGVYTFVCSAHPDQMQGSVTVAAVAQASTEPSRDGNPAPKPKAWASIDAPRSPALDVLLRGKLKLTARCSALDRGTVTLSVSKAVAKRLKLKGTTLATGRSRCDGNNRFTVTLKATSAAKKALAGSRKAVKATATLKFPGLTVKKPISLLGAR